MCQRTAFLTAAILIGLVWATNAWAGDIDLSPFAGRMKAEQREALVTQHGGNAASEAAVARGLEWLARQQHADGSWSFDGGLQEAPNSATGLALLPFLGAGHTHQEGKYKETIQKGLDFLLAHLKATNDSADLLDRGTMYGQAIATTAVCEAFGMTKDAKLKEPAQKLVRFIVSAQDPKGGGWRYQPKMPGDTSVTGWQIAALKAAERANLDVPADVFKAAMKYLDGVQSANGIGYGYIAPNPSPGMTASGLVSRVELGWDAKSPTVDKSVAFLSKLGPVASNRYYDYFATQALFHTGGEAWDKWNAVQRDKLVEAQEMQGDHAGSWSPNEDSFGQATGKLYVTSLSLLTLEVYYRQPPLGRK